MNIRLVYFRQSFSFVSNLANMPVIDPKTIPVPELHQLLVGSIGPRPIALASTVDAGGRPNLAPFSFFNIFSSNPPICIFSANLRVMNNTTKDTLRNVQQTGEVVINAVNFSIIRQVALASVEYPAEVSEFHETGLTPIASDLVKPFRVKESPVQFECKVKEILPLGENGGAGNLIVCEILRIHVDEKILDEQGKINPHKIDLMGRLGRFSGAEVCRILADHGFREVRRKGSHIVMQLQQEHSSRTVPVPDHKELKTGTLSGIIRLSGLPRQLFEV